MPEPQFNPEQIHEYKKMVKHYHSFLNDDFWGDIHGLGTSKKKNVQLIPIEVWESEEHLYLSIISPGLPDLNHAKIIFHNDQALTLKIKTRSTRPIGAVTLLSSELPQHSYEREIFLQKSVITSDYSSSYEGGVLTYTFKKADDELEIPFDF